MKFSRNVTQNLTKIETFIFYGIQVFAEKSSNIILFKTQYLF